MVHHCLIAPPNFAAPSCSMPEISAPATIKQTMHVWCRHHWVKYIPYREPHQQTLWGTKTPTCCNTALQPISTFHPSPVACACTTSSMVTTILDSPDSFCSDECEADYSGVVDDGYRYLLQGSVLAVTVGLYASAYTCGVFASLIVQDCITTTT